jgi:plasmid stabilization system protein ParE
MPKDAFIVYWTETAFQDLESIIDHIAVDNIDSALDIYKKIKNKSNSLVTLPFRGRIVPELRFHNIVTYRELIISPWRIVYRIESNTVYVVSVFDSRRNIEDLLLSRLIND